MFTVRPGIIAVRKDQEFHWTKIFYTTVEFISGYMLHIADNNLEPIISSRCLDDDNYNKPLSEVIVN